MSNVTLFVNKLNSDLSIIPYEYHSFDFCVGSEEESPVENLGQILFGERIRPSPYVIKFKEVKNCAFLCQKTYDPLNFQQQEKLSLLKRGMKLNYQQHWIVDNMPVTFCFIDQKNNSVCSAGFPIGCYVTQDGYQKDACFLDPNYSQSNNFYLFNHVNIQIFYRDLANDSNFLNENFVSRIIRIQIEPKSIKHDDFNNLNCDNNFKPLTIAADQKNVSIIYSYSISWKKTDIKWSSRWDYILDSVSNTNIQWFSIMNSLFIVFLLSGMVGMILFRTLYRDIAQYNKLNIEDDTQEEFGWKLIHADVFRPPRYGLLLSVFVGAGTQVLLCTMVTLIFACFGFLNPANRGSLMTFALFLYVYFGIIAGYTSAVIYKSVEGLAWKTCISLTSFLIPGIIFGVFFITNLIFWYKGSSATVPFKTLLTVLFLWLFISIPLTFIGAYYGFNTKRIEAPVRTNRIPRQIPAQAIYTKSLFGMILGGIIPFGCSFIQLFFIINSIWSHQVFYMFGFLFLAFIILIITCSETTIYIAYFQLCAENYHWWWRSFFTSGFTSVYLLLYCIHYFNTKLNITGTISTIIYFSYTGIFVFLFFLMTGTIGFFATFFFVRKIYASIKVD